MLISNFLPCLLSSLAIPKFIWSDDTIISNTNTDILFDSSKSYRPIVIFHGLGDNFNSTGGSLRMERILKELYPCIFVHSVYLDIDPEEDSRKSYFGDANKEVDFIAHQLSEIIELKGGFDALGLSQGGVLLRGVIERYSNLNFKTFVTFGSPNMGVSDFPQCSDSGDWSCKPRGRLLKKFVWSPAVQNSIIPAQFFRSTLEYDTYLKYSHFIADINNERVESYNSTYYENFSRLEQFVMIQFEKESVVVPTGSTGFNDIDGKTGEFIPFNETILYTKDLIGLKALDESQRIAYEQVRGEHMKISDEDFIKVAKKYLGSVI